MRCLQERIARIKLDGTVDKTPTHTRTKGNLYYKSHYFQKESKGKK